jgi:hypothetical protein
MKFIYSYLIIILFLSACGKLKHQVSGETSHNVYHGIQPETLAFIEKVCNDQDEEQVADCIEKILHGVNNKKGKK